MRPGQPPPHPAAGSDRALPRFRPRDALRSRPGWPATLTAILATGWGFAGATAADRTDCDLSVAGSFDREVMAVLSKAGCNAGTCHGNLQGKGGLFLSLRGQDAPADWREIVESSAGRRINLLEPERSLLLLKATGQVPHGGGRRFSPQDVEFHILAAWLRAGAPAPDEGQATITRLEVVPADAVVPGPAATVPLRVTAVFGSGESVDVTRLAVFEPADPRVVVTADGLVHLATPQTTSIAVRYLTSQAVARVAVTSPRDDAGWTGPAPANLVDEVIFARLARLGIDPAPPADDLVFLRRIHLDLLGTLPTVAEARSFAADAAADKRQRLVDDLLARPEWADVWAGIWGDLLRNEEKTLDARGVETFHAWIRRCFHDDVPLDRFVREILTARGSAYAVPPANFWRGHREPVVRAETVAQVFLGVRLQCANCHNHPFDRWLQEEYHDWTALFTGIEYEIVENSRQDKLDKHEFVGDQIVQLGTPRERPNPRTGGPAVPRLLDGRTPPEGDRLEVLADWITAPENRRFARTQVNRIWYHVMGRGLVEPVDDLRDTNPASHPELLERLTDEFIASGYRVRDLVRTICTSHTYAASVAASPRDGLAGDESLFAAAIVRRRTAERILDAQARVLGATAAFEGYPAGTRAGMVAGVERVRRRTADGDRFLRLFGRPARLLACECERSNEPTLAQALDLVGGEGLQARISAADNRLAELLAADRDPEAIVEELFWTALARPPTPVERSTAVASFASAVDPRTAIEDLAWALLNAKELLFRN